MTASKNKIYGFRALKSELDQDRSTIHDRSELFIPRVAIHKSCYSGRIVKPGDDGDAEASVLPEEEDYAVIHSTIDRTSEALEAGPTPHKMVLLPCFCFHLSP